MSALSAKSAPTPRDSCGLYNLGGMAKKPVVIEDRIEIRKLLCITISLDHMITDGAPAARFVNRLKHLIETCSGLEFCQQDTAPPEVVS